MPFEHISVGSSSRNNPAVAISVYERTHNSGTSCDIQLRFSLEVIERLGWIGGERLAIQEGFGGDAMLLKITRAKEGQIACTLSMQRGGAAKPSSGAVRFAGNKLKYHTVSPGLPITEVMHQAFGGEVLLMLPASHFAPITIVG